MPFFAHLFAGAPPQTSDYAALIGPYGALVLSLMANGWLMKRLSQSEAARDTLYDRIIELGQTISPLLERAARALEHTDGGGR